MLRRAASRQQANAGSLGPQGALPSAALARTGLQQHTLPYLRRRAEAAGPLVPLVSGEETYRPSHLLIQNMASLQTAGAYGYPETAAAADSPVAFRYGSQPLGLVGKAAPVAVQGPNPYSKQLRSSKCAHWPGSPSLLMGDSPRDVLKPPVLGRSSRAPAAQLVP